MTPHASSSVIIFISLYGLPLPMQRSRPNLVFKPSPSFRPLPISLSLSLSLCVLPTTSCLWLFSYTPYFLFPVTCSGFFNGMSKIFDPGALNIYTSSHLILWILSVSRNPTLIRLPLFRFRDTLLCDLIALTPSLAFFLPMSHQQWRYSQSRVYPSLKFLPPLFD